MAAGFAGPSTAYCSKTFVIYFNAILQTWVMSVVFWWLLPSCTSILAQCYYAVMNINIYVFTEACRSCDFDLGLFFISLSIQWSDLELNLLTNFSRCHKVFPLVNNVEFTVEYELVWRFPSPRWIVEADVLYSWQDADTACSKTSVGSAFIEAETLQDD